MVEKAAPHHPSRGAQQSGGISEVLTKIIAKEQELEASLDSARDEAARQIAGAKDRAASIIESHRKAAESEAAAVKEAALRTAREEAERITAAGQGSLSAVRAVPRERIEGAVGRLLEMVLPAPRQEVKRQ